ncbi:hypothetical protein TELCIR_06462 [Teladorsagia circumcincta]|uniref:BRO1 domain-containing protein n=1 Tax=Teladorsagia circumcincta TaxID=45464 RepID=A0A2G9UMW9_TELCI|nr:hypothetical protein TELCIR_06462 [Teladorsagia circumcincta]
MLTVSVIQSQNSVADTFLERAAVLFNYGAVLSLIAASQSFLTDDETKTAAKLFQQSAEKMNPSALVKIAAQTGDFYSEASKLMDISKSYWKKEWLDVVSGKALGFQAIAELHQAQVHWERHEVGDRLCRLKQAFELVEKMKRRMPPSCLREQISEIENAHKSATSDNRLIVDPSKIKIKIATPYVLLYHERIPDFFTLPALPRAVLAKATPVEKQLFPGFKDLFATVVPETALVAMKKFDKLKAERLQRLKDRLSEQTELMDGIVASLNVPDVVPDDVKRKSAEVKGAGGVTNMRKKLDELTVLHKRNNDLAADIDRVLIEENRSDVDLRHQLRSEHVRITSDELVKGAGGVANMRKKLDELTVLHKRNNDLAADIDRVLIEENRSDVDLRHQLRSEHVRMTSDELVGPFVQELSKHLGDLKQAAEVDKALRTLFSSNEKAIDMLSKSEVEV